MELDLFKKLIFPDKTTYFRLKIGGYEIKIYRIHKEFSPLNCPPDWTPHWGISFQWPYKSLTWTFGGYTTIYKDGIPMKSLEIFT